VIAKSEDIFESATVCIKYYACVKTEWYFPCT